MYVASSYDHKAKKNLTAAADPHFRNFPGFHMYKMSPSGLEVWRVSSPYVLHSSPTVDSDRGKGGAG